MKPITFNVLADAVNKAWQRMLGHPLYFLNCSGQGVWHTYYDNLIDEKVFKSAETTEHYCFACRDFFYKFGNIIALFKDNDDYVKRMTLWDIALEDTEIMDSQYSSSIRMLHKQATEGIAINRAAVISKDYIESINHKTKARIFEVGLRENCCLYDGDKTIYKFHHFYLEIPEDMVTTCDRNEQTSILGAKHDVMKRTFEEIKREAWETVRDLINQGSLLKSKQFLVSIESMIELYKGYEKHSAWTVADIPPRIQWMDYIWFASNSPYSNLRSDLIGEVAIELSVGKDINKVCRDFNYRVDPKNYKKATAPITEAQKQSAQKYVEENYPHLFERRTATIEDVREGILHTYDPTDVKKPSAFDSLNTVSKSSPHKRQELDKVPVVPVATFINDILPNAKSVYLFLENNMEGKCMHLTTAVYPEAKSPFTWGTPFSWTFANNLSGESEIEKAVKEYGGVTDAPYRVSLMWNKDGNAPETDLDLTQWEDNEQFEMREDRMGHVWFGNKTASHYGCQLDVDIRVPEEECSRTNGMAVENIYSHSKIQNADFDAVVFNFNGEQESNFELEIVTPDAKAHFKYNGRIAREKCIKVAHIKVRNGSWEITPLNKSVEMTTTNTSKNIWGLDSNQFHRVLLAMESPNGNNASKQFFFFLEGMKDNTPIRTVHPDHLNADLLPHRQVLDYLADTQKVVPSNDALAGIGFNTDSTKEQYAIVKVIGTHTRVLKVKF